MMLRQLTERDAAAWRACRLRALQDDAFAFLATHDEDARMSVDDIARRLAHADPATTIFGAFDGEQLVGSVGIARREQTKARHRVVLWGMHVVAEVRRRGIGEALVRRALEHVRQLGDVDQVELTVAESARAARDLYERVGFRRCGDQPRAMKTRDGYIDEAVMILVLG